VSLGQRGKRLAAIFKSEGRRGISTTMRRPAEDNAWESVMAEQKVKNFNGKGKGDLLGNQSKGKKGSWRKKKSPYNLKQSEKNDMNRQRGKKEPTLPAKKERKKNNWEKKERGGPHGGHLF